MNEDERDIIEAQPMMLLPPPPGKCQTCGIKHDPEWPHDAQSLFYCVKFKMEHGREPTWDDALAHVSDELHDFWREELAKHGVEVTRRWGASDA